MEAKEIRSSKKRGGYQKWFVSRRSAVPPHPANSVHRDLLSPSFNHDLRPAFSQTLGLTCICGSARSSAVPRVLQTCIPAMAVENAKRTLMMPVSLARDAETFLTKPGSTYHSKAPNTVAACSDLHGLPRRHPLSDSRTATAMKPANQKIMVTNSAARMPVLVSVSLVLSRSSRDTLRADPA